MPSPRVHPDIWAAEHRVYPETAGVPGPRDPTLTPYGIPFGRAVHSGETKTSVFVCGAQMGKTDTELDMIGASLDQRPVPILFVGPTKDFINDQFEPRIMGLLDEAKTLKDKVVRGRKMKKSLKWINGVKLRLAHGGSSSQLKSDPAGLAIIDEYDEMLANIRGQGDVYGLVDARGQTYVGFKMAVTSTPGVGYVETEIDPMSGLEFWKVGDAEQIESPIWRLWQQGLRYHWAWPCPHCHEYFIPRFKILKWADGTPEGMKEATPAQARRTVHIDCPSCGTEITDQDDKEWMNARGVEVAPGEKVKLDDKTGGPIKTGTPDEEGAQIWSLWVSGLASPFVTWGERIETYLIAVNSADPARIQTARNAQFGELYSIADNAERPRWEAMMDRKLPYKLRQETPLGVLRVVAGVDVQLRSLYYVIRGYGARGQSWLLDYGQLHGRTDDFQVWETLTDVLTDPLPGGLLVEKVMVDSGFRPDKPEQGQEHMVYQYCRDNSWFATAAKGKDVQFPPYRVTKIEVNRKGEKIKTSIDLAWLSSDFFKSLVYGRINMPIEQVGGLFIPEDVTEDYARQVTSEIRALDPNGKPFWQKLAKDNHYLDCEALAAAAAYTLNVHKIPEGVERDVEDDENSSSPKGDNPAPISKSRDVASSGDEDTGGGSSIRDRFRNRSKGLNRRK